MAVRFTSSSSSPISSFPKIPTGGGAFNPRLTYQAEYQASGSSKEHTTLPAPDKSLVSVGDGVKEVLVFRNVISSDEEELIWEELTPLLKKEGTPYFAEARKVDDKKLRNTYLEVYGLDVFTELKNWKKKETKKVPGFTWSPTLVHWLRRHRAQLDALLLGEGTSSSSTATNAGGLSSTGVSGGGGLLTSDTATDHNTNEDEQIPVDMGRIVEHIEPGYEMHTEHPTIGRSFMHLNLLSDTVLSFDDEVTQRKGQVYLPQRSLMVCSGELRWGWRFGESSAKTLTYTSQTTGLVKRITPDVRLSIQCWKYNPNLADRRQLQSFVENAVSDSVGSIDDADEDISKRRTGPLTVDAFNTGPASSNDSKDCAARGGGGPLSSSPDGSPDKKKNKNIVQEGSGIGKLGGDLAENEANKNNNHQSPQDNMENLDEDFNKYKTGFNRITGLLNEMSQRENAGAPVSDDWMRENMQFPEGQQTDKYGFDPANPEQTWEQIENKARFYRDKIRSMDYYGDGSNQNNSDGSLEIDNVPPASSEALQPQRLQNADKPLNMKEALKKLMPDDKRLEKYGLPNMPQR